MKKLLILGGSVNAIQILETAKANNIEVGVADYYEHSKCKDLADYSFCVDCFDVEAISNLIKNHNFDGIITGYSEQLLSPYSSICEKTGLHCYGNNNLFNISTNKDLFKERCHRYGVPVMPEYEYTDVIKKAIYPVVVKPVDSAGSFGIGICENANEFIEKYPIAVESSKRGKVLIEKKASGREATFFFYFQNGTAYLTTYGERLMYVQHNQNLPLPVGYIFPAPIERSKVDRFVTRMRNLFESEGFKDGMAFAQTFIEEDDIYLCEIGYRLTPSFETFIINRLNGFDPLLGMVKASVGDQINKDTLQNIDPHNGYGANITLLLKEGTISSYQGLKEIEQLPYVIKVLAAWEPGHKITKNVIGTLAQVGVRILLTDSSQDDLIKRMDHIKNSIKVLDTNGKDLTVRDYSYKALCEKIF